MFVSGAEYPTESEPRESIPFAAVAVAEVVTIEPISQRPLTNKPNVVRAVCVVEHVQALLAPEVADLDDCQATATAPKQFAATSTVRPHLIAAPEEAEGLN